MGAGVGGKERYGNGNSDKKLRRALGEGKGLLSTECLLALAVLKLANRYPLVPDWGRGMQKK